MREPTEDERQIEALQGKVLIWGGGRARRCGYCWRDLEAGERYEIQWVNRDEFIEDFRWFHEPECPPVGEGFAVPEG